MLLPGVQRSLQDLQGGAPGHRNPQGWFWVNMISGDSLPPEPLLLVGLNSLIGLSVHRGMQGAPENKVNSRKEDNKDQIGVVQSEFPHSQ